MDITKLLLSLLLLSTSLHEACTLSFTPRSGLKGESWAVAIQQAKALVAKLTLDEKVSLTTGIGTRVGPCLENIRPVPRVNFPGLCLQDSPTGVRHTDFASAFPASVNIAAVWDRNVSFAVGSAMGAEFRGKGANVALGPMMNLARVAAGGRNWEGSGGEPYLVGELVAQNIMGIQSQGVVACAKHYIGNEQEHYRTSESSVIDDRTLHELYAYPFLQSVLAGVGSVMCSYNQVNGTYACQNNYTLNQILKGEFGFLGYVRSDAGATMNDVASVLAGMDMDMPGDPGFSAALLQAVGSGAVPLARLDDMVTRILTTWYLTGQNQGFPPTNLNAINQSASQHVHVGGDHYQLIREVGAASTILLKNVNNQLPFTPSTTGSGIYTFGLVGSDAGPGVNGPNSCPDHGCVDGTLAQGWGSGTTNFPYLITPLEAIDAVAQQNGQTLTFTLDDWDIPAAVQVAQQSDVAIVFAASDSGEDYITVYGNQGDRNNLSLWNNGDNLIEAVAGVNKNTVVVLHVVGPILMPWANHPNITAIVLAGLPGQESGNSLVDVLFGNVSPSGKLVYTIAKQISDYPAQVLYSSPAKHPVINYTEGLLIDYRWFDAKNIAPLFPFGFGLSYTTFTYSNLQIQPTSSLYELQKGHVTNYADPTLFKVQVSITNSGKVAGNEVAQLYIAYPPSAGEPPQVLRGFERVYLAPGQTLPVVFYLSELQLSIWDVKMQDWAIPAGQYQAFVGASSRDIRLKGTFSPSM